MISQKKGTSPNTKIKNQKTQTRKQETGQKHHKTRKPNLETLKSEDSNTNKKQKGIQEKIIRKQFFFGQSRKGNPNKF